MARLDEPIGDVARVEFSTGNQLKQAERRTIERGIAKSRGGGGEFCNLALECSSTVSVRIAIGPTDIGDRSFRDRRCWSMRARATSQVGASEGCPSGGSTHA